MLDRHSNMGDGIKGSIEVKEDEDVEKARVSGGHYSKGCFRAVSETETKLKWLIKITAMQMSLKLRYYSQAVSI